MVAATVFGKRRNQIKSGCGINRIVKSFGYCKSSNYRLDQYQIMYDKKITLVYLLSPDVELFHKNWNKSNLFVPNCSSNLTRAFSQRIMVVIGTHRDTSSSMKYLRCKRSCIIFASPAEWATYNITKPCKLSKC